jgi:ABC-type antimicrobial peptide transport system permease subunit
LTSVTAFLTVTIGLSFKKFFSPMPFTFISSSNSYFWIVSAMFMRVTARCAHQLRPPAQPLRDGRATGRFGYCLGRGSLPMLLYQVTASDPATLVITTLVLAVVTFAACLLPARRAASVDPLTAVRG